MKNKTSLVWFAAVAIVTGTAFAKHPPLFHRQVTEKSDSGAMGAKPLQVLQRRSGPGRKAAADMLLAKLERAGLAKAGDERRSDDAEAHLLDAPDWRLQTRGTGEWALYENLAKTRQLNEKDGVPPGQQPTIEQLEGPGRNFIKSVLSDVVHLGANETLEAWSVTHQKGVSGDIHGTYNESVVASKIGFTRAINGVAVIGSGSKIGVTFDTHGNVLGFDIDWPDYVPMVSAGKNAAEPTVDVGTVRQRLKKVRASRSFAKLVDERPLECGYYDAGTLVAGSAGVRGACQAHYMTASADGHRRMGFVDTVPIGEAIVKDSSWPEAVLLQK
jgi:hypothetical protein